LRASRLPTSLSVVESTTLSTEHCEVTGGEERRKGVGCKREIPQCHRGLFCHLIYDGVSYKLFVEFS